MENPETRRSYSDAFAKVFTSPAKDGRAGSYAELNRRSASPSPKEYYSGSPKKTISVLQRPIRDSNKNTENLDVQFEKDKGAFERRANTYRRLAGEKYHHHRAASSILTLWEAGHIVDRGRGRPDAPAASNPMQVGSEPQAVTGAQGRPQSARSASCKQPAARPTSAMRTQMGDYDPILHVYTRPRDPGYESQRGREFDKANGMGNNGTKKCVDNVRASFDPILGQTRPASPAPRPASARPAAAAAASAPPGERAATPGKRNHVSQGDSWGTYNPILHNWAAPPLNPKFQEQNVVLNQKAGISGTHSRKPVERPRSQGVYNPILNHWVVAPADTRVLAGLSFAPAALFSQPAVQT